MLIRCVLPSWVLCLLLISPVAAEPADQGWEAQPDQSQVSELKQLDLQVPVTRGWDLHLVIPQAPSPYVGLVQSGSQDAQWQRIDLRTGQLGKPVAANLKALGPAFLGSAALSGDGRYAVATTSGPGAYSVVSLENGNLVKQIEGKFATPFSIAFAMAGKWLLMPDRGEWNPGGRAGPSAVLKMHDLEEGGVRDVPLAPMSEGLTGIAISPNARYAAVADKKRIGLVDLEKGQLLGVVPIPAPERGRIDRVGLGFSYAGDRLAAMVSTGPWSNPQLLVLDATTGATIAHHQELVGELRPKMGPMENAPKLMFAPDGQHVMWGVGVVSVSDGSVRTLPAQVDGKFVIGYVPLSAESVLAIVPASDIRQSALLLKTMPVPAAE